MTNKQLLTRVRYWIERMGLEDFNITIEVYSDSAGDLAAAMAPEPQYKRATLRINTGQKDFNADPDWHIKHELGHILLGMLCQAAFHNIEDTNMRKVLNDLEDEVVTRIALMPALAE